MLRFSLYFHNKSEIHQRRHAGESRHPGYHGVKKPLDSLSPGVTTRQEGIQDRPPHHLPRRLLSRPDADLLRPLVDEHPDAGAYPASRCLGLPEEPGPDGVVDHVHHKGKAGETFPRNRRIVRVGEHPHRGRVDEDICPGTEELCKGRPGAPETAGQFPCPLLVTVEDDGVAAPPDKGIEGRPGRSSRAEEGKALPLDPAPRLQVKGEARGVPYCTRKASLPCSGSCSPPRSRGHPGPPRRERP